MRQPRLLKGSMLLFLILSSGACATMSTLPDRTAAVDRLKTFLETTLSSLDGVQNVEVQQPPHKTTTCFGAGGGLTSTSSTRFTIQAELGEGADPQAAVQRVEDFWREMGLEVRQHQHAKLPWITTRFDGYYGEMSIGLETGRFGLTGSTPCLPDG